MGWPLNVFFVLEMNEFVRQDEAKGNEYFTILTVNFFLKKKPEYSKESLLITETILKNFI